MNTKASPVNPSDRIIFIDALRGLALFGILMVNLQYKIKRWSIFLVLVPPIITALLIAMVWALSQIPEAKEAMNANIQESVNEITRNVEHATTIYAEGSFSEIISVRIKEYLTILPGSVFIFPVILGMFLLGFLLARKKILTEYMNHLCFFKKLFWWGIGIGIPANTLYAIASHYSILSIPNGWMLLETTMHICGGIAFGLSFISGMAILFAKKKTGIFRKFLAPVGRMALTNYLLHSIIGSFLFYSYGLGLIGKVEVWQGIIIAVLIFLAQVAFSRWWLSHYKFGPLEWLWRSLTYMKRP